MPDQTDEKLAREWLQRDGAVPSWVEYQLPSLTALLQRVREAQIDLDRAQIRQLQVALKVCDEMRVQAVEQRDAEWAAALDSKNVGTDYGAFLADPQRAGQLIKAHEGVAASERDAEWVRAVREAVKKRTASGKYPTSAFRRYLSEWVAGVETVGDDVLKRMGVKDE